MNNPKIASNDFDDDVSTISDNIDELYNQYVKIIDTYRSQTKTIHSTDHDNSNKTTGKKLTESRAKNTSIGIEVNPLNFMESRTHAFYRMIGLPVVSPKGKFYNPGFNKFSTKSESNKAAVDFEVFQEAKTTINLIKSREDYVHLINNIFAQQSYVSSIYSLGLFYNKPFNMFGEGTSLNPFDDNPQKITINDRKNFFASFKYLSLGSPEFSTLYSPVHILKPFMVDFAICDNVNPQSAVICVPFLKNKTDTQYEDNKFLKRPILEFIIRKRLSILGAASDVFQEEILSNIKAEYSEIEKVINKQPLNPAKALDDYILDDMVSVITGNEKLDNEGVSILEDLVSSSFFNPVYFTIRQLTKQIKVILKVLVGLNNDLSTLIQKHLFPKFSIYGIEYGGEILNSSLSKELNQDLLKIKQLEALNTLYSAKMSAQEEEIGGIGTFATELVFETQKDFKSKIEKIKSEINEDGRKIISIIQQIDKITGESTGLGIIDVLAIYTALWSIDIGDLVGLLDDEAWERMNAEFKELVNGIGKSRNKDILKVLSNFEQKVRNVLSFADREFKKLHET